MNLKKLFSRTPGLKWKGSKEAEISGVCNDSKRVAPGNLFIAKKGRCVDATRFVSEAVSNGAVAVLTDFYDPFLDKKIVQIIHPDPAHIEAEISARYYSYPSQELFLIGITGTSGKTTTTYLIRHLLQNLGTCCGMIGTVEVMTHQNSYPSSMTTYDAMTNQKFLREMVLAGCKACAMEVSSHGLDQGRTDCIDFDIALFTNLTHEHLDYHKDIAHYLSSKRKLFSTLLSEKNGKKCWAILNADSSVSEKIASETRGSVFFYGMEKKADLRASDIETGVAGTKATLTWKNEKEVFSIPLIGTYNLSNLLAAVSVGLVRGSTLCEMKNAFVHFPQVPGRLERVDQKNPFSVFVDYAHKVDALSQVLQVLRKLCKKRILTLFGCGGNRDREKRPLMAKVAEEFSDFVVVTSDNPRSEEPQKIADEILAGFASNRYLVELDRRKAIEKIVRMAQKDDLILIAGKGHETYQIFSHKRCEFDDRKVAKEMCDALYAETT